jgi:quercetin dioxygenase-like cupin family protein
MKLVRIADADLTTSGGFGARPLLEGDQSNVRVIRLEPAASLPPHRHGTSDLMLYVVDGEGELETSTRTSFVAGSLAFYPGHEELRVHNTGSGPMTLLAFLTPKFATS